MNGKNEGRNLTANLSPNIELASVVNVPFVKPLDVIGIVEVAKSSKLIVTVENHSIIGGLGSAVSEVVGEECPVVVKKVGVNDSFGESGTPAELLKKYGLTSNDIVKAVKEAITKK